MGWWMMPFGMVFVWIFWGFVVYVIYRQLTRSEPSFDRILKTRLAKGEITKEEYDQLKKHVKEE